ncbi:ADA17-like protein [Mya arenaria]|uniref:ADA17-like protein n=1 Tax=Mya arenaria TaxID=6604 RepID=A0ABY7EPU5_MYAAR|nr:ADA17-like protein [Mya arenaria]
MDYKYLLSIVFVIVIPGYDDRSAVANLNFEDSGAILANIVTADDTYVIEPSYRHLPDSENHTMIAYRRSDVKFEDADQGLHSRRELGKEHCVINMIQFVNTIYRKTQFDVQNEMMTGVGFEIGEAFSFDKYFKKYCLAHLFTSRRFDDGVLVYPKYPGVSMTLNTGWSSSLNSAGHRILALQALLITAHDNCAPSDYKDGKYLMYPWAVMGYDKNNQFLSPCSREYIFKVIKVKGYDCFIEGRGDGAFCGNGRLDEKEECDAGYDTIKDIDPCCDSDCQLRDGKVCSPMNYDCCTAECKPASSSKICRPELNEMCSGEIKCKGTCKDGMCLNYCENFAYDLTPCICAGSVYEAEK